MDKRIVVIVFSLVIVFVLALFLLMQPPPVSKTVLAGDNPPPTQSQLATVKEHCISGHSICLSLSSDWSSSLKNGTLAFFTGPDGVSTVNIAISLTPTHAYGSAYDITAKELVGDMETYVQDLQLESLENSSIGRIKVKEMVSTFSIQMQRYTAKQLMYVKGPFLYIITLMSFDNIYPSLEPTFTQVIHSIRFTSWNVTAPIEHPLLWKIESDPPSYLFGTIHLPDKRALALPSSVLVPLSKAETIYTEIPLDSSSMTKTASLAMLPTGQTLKDLLPSDLYARVSNYTASKGYPLAMFNNLKIWALIMNVALLDHMTQMLNIQPQDVFLYAFGTAFGKETKSLETIEEQISIFDSLTIDEQIYYLNLTIEHLEKYRDEGRDPFEELLLIYLSGDEEALFNATISDLDKNDQISQELFKKLYTDRNLRFVNNIERALLDNSGKTLFFAIGSGHYGGEEGILNLLEAKGFEIVRVE